MEIDRITLEKTKVYCLQNSVLSVEVIPAEGGRISSLRSMSSGLEFLTRSERVGPYPEAGMNTRFRDGSCAGIEECLPTVGPSGPETDGGAAPDHGDFWQLPWQVSQASDTEISLSAQGFSRPLGFHKRLTLDRDTLRVSYSVENRASCAQSFLYACHPLFAVSTGDRILLPPETRSLTLDHSRRARLGPMGSTVAWPVALSGHRLDVALGPDAGTAEMFYSSRLHQGICGIHRCESDQVLEVSFETQRLPYLGVWLCYGGWPDDSEGPRQYAVALEPTTAPYNTLARAQQAKAALVLKPSERYDWAIAFSVGKPGGSPLNVRQ